MLRKVSLAVFVVLAGCGSARVIYQSGNTGTIELSGDRQKAMEQATAQMNQICGPNNYQITAQGEEAVGTDTVTQDQSHTSRNGRNTQGQEQTSTRTATAWRIHFQCGGGGGAPPPAGPPPGGDPNAGGQPPPPPAGGGY